MSNSRQSVPNFRDVGLWVNELSGRPLLREGMLYRSGALPHGLTEFGVRLGSVVNLTGAAHAGLQGVRQVHCPRPRGADCYMADTRPVRGWLRRVFSELSALGDDWPVLVHCNAGKDRTGVVIGAVLLSVGVAESVVMEEYMLSAGELDPDRFAVAMTALSGDLDSGALVAGTWRRRLLATSDG